MINFRDITRALRARSDSDGSRGRVYALPMLLRCSDSNYCKQSRGMEQKESAEREHSHRCRCCLLVREHSPLALALMVAQIR